ncbi:hypothetical protein PBRA_002443 [Plasmodiophora brassicae]|uniref:Uncharacterized protein n=1 Tax=Plasmodiophora brassicae TaxID=37360 RepID=A0A0G4J3I9_PLABS|nr:hypothetical protein PBRA_002443 [Plasmodiophora brassicae]
MGRRVQLLAKRYVPDLDKQCLAHIVRDVMTRADANRLEVVSTGEHASVTDEGRTSGACAESLRKTVLRLARPESERPSTCRWHVLLWLFFKRRRVMIDAIRQAWTQCNVEGREIVIVPQLWRDPWRVSNPRDDVRIYITTR